jgi:hypothetical protein
MTGAAELSASSRDLERGGGCATSYSRVSVGVVVKAMRVVVCGAAVIAVAVSAAGCASDDLAVGTAATARTPQPTTTPHTGDKAVSSRGLQIDVPESWTVVDSYQCHDFPGGSVILNEAEAEAACGIGIPEGASTRVEFFDGTGVGLPRDGSSTPTETTVRIGGRPASRTEVNFYDDYAVLVSVPSVKASVMITGAERATVERVAASIQLS